MNQNARHLRNLTIVQLAREGLSQRAIADRVGLTERQCRRVIKESRAAEDPSLDPKAAIEQSLARLGDFVIALAQSAKAASPDTPKRMHAEMLLQFASRELEQITRNLGALNDPPPHGPDQDRPEAVAPEAEKETQMIAMVELERRVEATRGYVDLLAALAPIPAATAEQIDLAIAEIAD